MSMKQISCFCQRALLLGAVCCFLLPTTLGYNAAGADPSESYLPVSSFGGDKPARADFEDDVILFMQSITFPSSPAPGALLEFGGTPGIWAGINKDGHFLAQVGASRSDTVITPTGLVRGPRTAAVITSDGFPKDDGLHDVLIYVKLGSSEERASIRVFIDCEHIGTGYTTDGPLGAWASGDNGAYLLVPGSNGLNYGGTGKKSAWSGGTASASNLHMYYKNQAGPASSLESLFEDFTAASFGCATACSATQVAQCDVVASANCTEGVSCTCSFPYEIGDGSPGTCNTPFFTAMTDSGEVRPLDSNVHAPSKSLNPKPSGNDYRSDAAFYMQGITFPPSGHGVLLEAGGANGGIQAGIDLDGNFKVTVSGAGGQITLLPGEFDRDGEKHSVLIYVQNYENGNEGVVKLWIDCELKGSEANSATKWSSGDNGAYLLGATANGFADHPSWGRVDWPGGIEGTGVLNIFTKHSNPALFAPFSSFYFGCENSCSASETRLCDRFADCARNGTGIFGLVGPEVWPEIECTCRPGFEGDGTTCEDINECLIESVTDNCDVIAECDNYNGSYSCVCPVGFVGEGDVCHDQSWAVRTVFETPGAETLTAEEIDDIKLAYAYQVMFPNEVFANQSIVQGMAVSFGANRYGDSIMEVLKEDADGQITLMALLLDKSEAEAAVARLNNESAPVDWSLIGTVVNDPAVYRWEAQTTGNAIPVNPSGLQVESVYFDPTCLSSGCWRIQITYTAGSDTMNVIYIPKAEGDDGASFDFDYTVDDSTWGISPDDTFTITEHPCTGTLDYDPSLGTLPASVTACCIPQFTAMYRPVSTFVDALDDVSGLSASLTADCALPTGLRRSERNRAVDGDEVPIIAQRGQEPDAAKNVFPRPLAPEVEGLTDYIFADGVFSGMTLSRINHTEVLDAYVGIYSAELLLDEVELRRLSGQLRGTVGVEHTVDTFVGKTVFSMTGIPFLDPFSTQVAIHLEKTNFFSVSTHGTNDYTFLEYVNMRLVMVHVVDEDFSGASEAGDRTVRTDSTGNIGYVQVTFTMGAQYEPNLDSGGLIPLDSVRAGKGTFLSDVDVASPSDDGEFTHVCDGWEGVGDTDGVGVLGFEVAKSTLTGQVGQPCGPQSTMCSSPATVPDQFVSFNVPLGKEVFEDPAGDLSNNIFVSMLINALDSTAGSGEAAQMKTTLLASIPIVDGGVNIFCDGFTAKTDLKDVANADIIVGSARNAAEFTRLRILEDIASTQLQGDDPADNVIDSASIESGLLTLVLKGNASYFTNGVVNTNGFALELDDVITIHVMEDGVAPTGRTAGDGSKIGTVMELLAAPADDNTDSATGLDTSGYALNGAFFFTVDRDAAFGDSRAMLEPSDALTAVCPFNPPRPAVDTTPLETCITRRDVSSRSYPKRTGAPETTAMEIASFADDQVAIGASKASGMSEAAVAAYLNALPDDSRESDFLTSVLGDSELSRQLAIDFAQAINAKYQLNGRYTRAYWINPGYEWTPTQTGDKSRFSISQKVYLFALISLDENWPASRRTFQSKRRALLQTETGTDALQESAAGLGRTEVTFDVTRTSLLANAFDVTPDEVAVFTVEITLTEAEACMAADVMQAHFQKTFDDWLKEDARNGAYHTVQVTQVSVEMNGFGCPGRRSRKLMSGFSAATASVEMAVVFKKEAKLNLEAFQAMPGVLAVTPAEGNNVEYVTGPPVPRADDNEGGSSSNTAVIAGACGGVGGALLVGVAAYMMMKSKRSEVPVAHAQTINVDTLKAQLAADV